MDRKTISQVMASFGRKGGRPPVLVRCARCGKDVPSGSMRYACPGHARPGSRAAKKKSERKLPK